MRVVIDASALLALLFNEPGADMVLELVRGASLSAVNMDEVLHKCARRGMDAGAIVSHLARLELDIRAFDHMQARISAALHPRAQPIGLSFADRACLALGTVMQAIVLTADRDLSTFDAAIDIRLIR
ncbi:type II toxin-antitoxin system VapC family toxin [Sphingomonas adhaesiva]|uniref:type II toxin-antitoxin system VapC family toxin n=1 Tax=Sphingomonas adhaesiva TaxID=28212 RepID=UPI002FF57CDF